MSIEFGLVRAAGRARVLIPARRAPFSVTTGVSSRASAARASALRIRSAEMSTRAVSQLQRMAWSSGCRICGQLDATSSWEMPARRSASTLGGGQQACGLSAAALLARPYRSYGQLAHHLRQCHLGTTMPYFLPCKAKYSLPVPDWAVNRPTG